MRRRLRQVAGRPAAQAGAWSTSISHLDLNVGQSSPVPLPTATPVPTLNPTQVAATATETARFTPLPAAALPTLFEPFQQASAAQAREGGGSGLGLWISRNLMRLHGGDLTIASVEGRGTEAIVTLPRERLLGDGAGETTKAVA